MSFVKFSPSPDHDRNDLWLAALAAVLFTFECWAFGPYSWMYGYGGGLETIPTHLALQFHDRLFSPWAPFIAGGLDRYAFCGNTDPLNWETTFIALFPAWLANGLHRFTQYFIAIFFAIKVCKEQLALTIWQARVGGILYACFSYFTFGEMLAVPALPMFLWLMRFSISSSKGWWLPFILGLGFSTFTTFTHTVPYLVAFAALWNIVVLGDISRKSIISLGLMAAGLTVGDLPQLIAALSNAASSHRVGFAPETVEWSIDSLLYRPLRFDYFNQDQIAKRIAWDLPFPLLTVGAIFAALNLYVRQKLSSLSKLYLRVYAIYFLLSQRWLLVNFQNIVGEWAPMIKGIFFGRFFDVPASFLIASQIAILVVLIQERFGTIKLAQYALKSGVAALVLFMLIEPKLFLFYRNGVDGWGQMNYEVDALEQLKNTEKTPFRVASVLPLQPAYAYAQGFETADGWANLYPKVYREYWLRVLAPLFQNVPGAKNIFDPEIGKPQDHYIFLGADLTHPTVGALPGEDIGRAVTEGFDIERRFDLKLLGQLNVKYLLSEFPLSSPGLELIHSPKLPPKAPYSRDWATGLLSPPSGPRGHGLWEKVRNATTDIREAVRSKSNGKDLFIYRLVWFAPRFRLVDEILIESSDRAVLDRLSSMNTADLGSTAIVNAIDADTLTSRKGLARGEIKLLAYHADRIDLSVTTTGDAFMIITNTWNPHWAATVNGKKFDLIRTNHIHYGLSLKPGDHNITIKYSPPYSTAFR